MGSIRYISTSIGSGFQGSITAAHASVGTAATCPITGTILSAADVTRHGAAMTPQPARFKATIAKIVFANSFVKNLLSTVKLAHTRIIVIHSHFNLPIEASGASLGIATKCCQ